MLLWQEIWSISCRVSPSYSISTTANNHQLGSAPDHLSLGNKEGDNSQWEAFYLNSEAPRRISSFRLPQTLLDISRLFTISKEWGSFYSLSVWISSGCARIFIIWSVYSAQPVWPARVLFPGLLVTFLFSSRQEMWKTVGSYHIIICRRQLLSNNCFLLTLLYGW